MMADQLSFPLQTKTNKKIVCFCVFGFKFHLQIEFPTHSFIYVEILQFQWISPAQSLLEHGCSCLFALLQLT